MKRKRWQVIKPMNALGPPPSPDRETCVMSVDTVNFAVYLGINEQDCVGSGDYDWCWACCGMPP